MWAMRIVSAAMLAELMQKRVVAKASEIQAA
jgi:hypothetical protein